MTSRSRQIWPLWPHCPPLLSFVLQPSTPTTFLFLKNLKWVSTLGPVTCSLLGSEYLLYPYLWLIPLLSSDLSPNVLHSGGLISIAFLPLQQKNPTSAFLPCGKNWIWVDRRETKSRKEEKSTERGRDTPYCQMSSNHNRNQGMMRDRGQFHDGLGVHWVWGPDRDPKWKSPVVSYFTK